jgi:hypothetical protein
MNMMKVELKLLECVLNLNVLGFVVLMECIVFNTILKELIGINILKSTMKVTF